MTLRDKPFERNLHAMLWTVRPPTWEQMRSWTRGATGAPPGAGGISRILFRLVMFPFALALASNGSVQLLVGAITFYTITTVLWQSSRLVGLLYRSPELPVYAHLPVPPDSIFALQRRAFLRGSAWVFLDFSILYGVLAYRVGFGIDSWGAGLMMGAIQWWVILAGVTLLLACFPRLSLNGLLLFSPLLLGVVAFLVLPYIFWNLAGWFSAAAPWIPPVGWIIRSLGADKRAGFVADFLPGLALGAMLTVFPLALRRLRAAYSPPEPFVLGTNLSSPARMTRGFIKSPPGRLVVMILRRVARTRPGNKSAPVLLASAPADPAGDKHGGFRASVRTRGFLAGYNWLRKGRCERFAARFLSPEDKLIAEFMGGGKPVLTRVVSVCVLSVLIPGAVVIVFPNWGGLLFPLFFVVSSLMAKGGGGWTTLGMPGAKLLRVGGQSTSMYTIYPVGFWGVIRVNIVIGLFAILAVCGSAVVLLMARYFYLQDPGLFNSASGGPAPEISWALAEGWKVIFLACAALPVFVIMPCSNGSNDIRSPGRFLAWMTGTSILAGAGICFFLAESSSNRFAAGAVFTGISGGCLWLYGRAYNRNGFDLIRKANRNDPTS